MQDTERIVARKGSNVCRSETIRQTHAQNKKREGQEDAIGRRVGRKGLMHHPADWRVLQNRIESGPDSTLYTLRLILAILRVIGTYISWVTL